MDRPLVRLQNWGLLISAAARYPENKRPLLQRPIALKIHTLELLKFSDSWLPLSSFAPTVLVYFDVLVKKKL